LAAVEKASAATSSGVVSRGTRGGEKTSAVLSPRSGRRARALFVTVISGGEKVSAALWRPIRREDERDDLYRCREQRDQRRREDERGTVATVEKTSGTFSDGERGTLARRREDECGNFYRCREQRHQRRREDMSARYRRQGRKDERGHSLVTVISRCEKMGARGTLSGVERGQTQQQPLPVS
jgi:hypothetical protein